MERSVWERWRNDDRSALILLALAGLVLHCVTNGRYGFHRDELAMLDDARHLDWGYVAYPPLTPWLGRVALGLFGTSLVGFRSLSALALSVSIVLAGLMARELGGGRWAQLVAASSAAIAPMALIMGALFQNISFDYLWWVLAAYLMVRLLRSEDPRWWLGIGGAIGAGMMTKYTILFLAAGIAAGVVLTPARRFLRSPWLWGGVALSIVLCLPNLIWQARHDFVSFDFLSRIHARDVEIGRAEGFLLFQPIVSANVFTLPLWTAGLYGCLFAPGWRRYRPLGWMFVVALLLFSAARGRFYYLAPAYPTLLAAGAVMWARRIGSMREGARRLSRKLTWGALAAGAALGGALMLPVAPVQSGWWRAVSKVHDNFSEEIGWPDLVERVAGVYSAQPENEKPGVGILAGNYGEAGAIDLYGPAHGLPGAISGINSYWSRGYGQPPPRTLIVVGFSRREARRAFAACEQAGRITNRYGVENEETRDHPEIFLCRGPRAPWPELWKRLRRFG